MTINELKDKMLKARADFYAWKPPGDEFRLFRCYHIEPYPWMTEADCTARAKRPDIYRNAGCSGSCPRWKYYRRQFKKTLKQPERRPYSLGWKEGDPR